MALLGALLLAGCNTTRLAYNNADWLVVRTADRYLDLTAEQERELRSRFAELHARHRQESLPRYAAQLGAAAAAVEAGLAPGEAGCLVAVVEAEYLTLVSELVPLAAWGLSSLSPEQRRHLAGRLEQRDRRYAETFLEADQSDRVAERVRFVARRLDRWIGPLTAAQEAALADLLRGRPDRLGEWAAYRRERQQGLLALVSAGADADTVGAYLERWWVRARGWPHRAEGRQTVVQVLELLDERLTAEQRRRLVDRLRGLAGDLDGLVPQQRRLPATAGGMCAPALLPSTQARAGEGA